MNKNVFMLFLFLSTVPVYSQYIELKPARLKKPETFGRTIVGVCKHGSLGQWKTLVSKRFYDLGDEFLISQFEIWRSAFKTVIEKYPNLNKIPVSVENEKLIKVAGIPVIVEKTEGRYYINER